ncbi:BadF/BadG/BcrA/BcrD ATPase family protein [Martelella alba]|uniref:N-acetylglucosamine kinase n=1 Tax=Martelella alba TaxID=2590451 RepID=A0ABY2SLJ8_9HYPH|nr:BadF/BadG/BcrA/BcrD ATPase family protein [Martelella alba]TKI06588.1 N-acetylglucosamine kinase [Martelella alba]
MQVDYYLGVDGGGTQCRSRLIDGNNQVLAEHSGGAANIYSSFYDAMSNVSRLVADTLQAASLPEEALGRTSVVFGLAGANVTESRRRAQAWPTPYARSRILSDVEIACLGAHRGLPGAVLIVGTGSQGAAWNGSQFYCLGGWGMALSDQGSGAVLGQRAMRLALQSHEAMIPSTALTRALMAQFNNSPENLLRWSSTATPADWGRCVPLIFKLAGKGDKVGQRLLKKTVDEIKQMVLRLTDYVGKPLCLMGGLAQPIMPWLAPDIRRKIVPAQGDALDGALLLASKS